MQGGHAEENSHRNQVGATLLDMRVVTTVKGVTGNTVEVGKRTEVSHR
jgi:hypothetical protein